MRPDADLQERDGDWSRLRGHDEDGAVLVPPNGHVAFRAPSVLRGPIAALYGAVAVALGKAPNAAAVEAGSAT